MPYAALMFKVFELNDLDFGTNFQFLQLALKASQLLEQTN